MSPSGLGFILQDRGAMFVLKEGHANTFAPGKRPFHTIIPAFITRDGGPWASFGVMGGDMQPQGHVKIVMNLIDFGMNLQEAGAAHPARRFDHARCAGRGDGRRRCRRPRIRLPLRNRARSDAERPCGAPTAPTAVIRRSAGMRRTRPTSAHRKAARTVRRRLLKPATAVPGRRLRRLRFASTAARCNLPATLRTGERHSC